MDTTLARISLSCKHVAPRGRDRGIPRFAEAWAPGARHDFWAWYTSTSFLALLSIVALAGWGFYHSLGGEPLWVVEPE
jgi:hypothetical protein